MSQEFRFTLHMPTIEGAAVLQQALAVDAPFPKTTRSVSIFPHNKQVVQIVITANESRTLRVASHAILEEADIMLRAMEAFAPAVHAR